MGQSCGPLKTSPCGYYTIVKVSSTGVVSPFVADYISAPEARLLVNPRGITPGQGGHGGFIVVSSVNENTLPSDSSKILKVSAEGTITLVAEAGLDSRFLAPDKSGGWLLPFPRFNAVHGFTAAGNEYPVSGSSLLKQPSGICADKLGGFAIVNEASNSAVRLLSTAAPTTAPTPPPPTPPPFSTTTRFNVDLEFAQSVQMPNASTFKLVTSSFENELHDQWNSALSSFLFSSAHNEHATTMVRAVSVTNYAPGVIGGGNITLDVMAVRDGMTEIWASLSSSTALHTTNFENICVEVLSANDYGFPPLDNSELRVHKDDCPRCWLCYKGDLVQRYDMNCGWNTNNGYCSAADPWDGNTCVCNAGYSGAYCAPDSWTESLSLAEQLGGILGAVFTVGLGIHSTRKLLIRRLRKRHKKLTPGEIEDCPFDYLDKFVMQCLRGRVLTSSEESLLADNHCHSNTPPMEVKPAMDDATINTTTDQVIHKSDTSPSESDDPGQSSEQRPCSFHDAVTSNRNSERRAARSRSMDMSH
jgi:hypothetical protein